MFTLHAFSACFTTATQHLRFVRLPYALRHHISLYQLPPYSPIHDPHTHSSQYYNFGRCRLHGSFRFRSVPACTPLVVRVHVRLPTSSRCSADLVISFLRLRVLTPTGVLPPTATATTGTFTTTTATTVPLPAHRFLTTTTVDSPPPQFTTGLDVLRFVLVLF